MMDIKSKLPAVGSVGMIILALTILGLSFVVERDAEQIEPITIAQSSAIIADRINDIKDGETRTITADNRTEWLTFTVTETTHAIIEINRTDVVMALLSNNREELLAGGTNDTVGDTQHISICNKVALLPGVYEIGIESEQKPLTYQVTLTFNPERCTTSIPAAMRPIREDKYEPDTHLISATVITDGEIQTHTLHTAADEDLLTFTLTETTNVILTTYGETGDPVLELYKFNGTRLAYNDDSTESHFSSINLCEENALPAGTYYLLIHTFAHQTTLPSYQVELKLDGDCTADVYEYAR